MESKLSNIKHNPFTEANKYPKDNKRIDIGLDIDIDQEFEPDEDDDSTLFDDDEFLGFDEEFLMENGEG